MNKIQHFLNSMKGIVFFFYSKLYITQVKFTTHTQYLIN